MDLKMEVYTPSLELVGLLEIQRSVIWEEKAFSAGSFSVESLITGESRQLLVPDNIIWIEGDTAGIIEYINQESDDTGPYISVKGRTLTGILDRRILLGQYNLSGTVPAIMQRLVDDCCIHPTRGDPAENRVIPGLALASAPVGGASIRVQKTGGSLLEALEELGEAYQVAYGVRFNPNVPRMEFWTSPGVDRSVNQTVRDPVFYSTELDDVLSSAYSYDSGDYRNVAYVAGEGEGDERVMVTVEELVDRNPDPPEPPEPPDPPDPPDPPEPVMYTIVLSVDPEGGGTASGGGSAEEGAQATVTAVPSGGYEFVGWRENGAIVSTEAAYAFTVSADRALVAEFAAAAGISWQPSTMPSSANWYAVAFGNGKFAAITYGSAAKTAYSLDGVNWTVQEQSFTGMFMKMAYGGNRFVALSYNGSIAAYSTDGVSWETAALPSSGNWRGVSYGNDRFVAVAYNTNKAAYSVDGISWTAVSIPSNNWCDTAYGDGKFVAVAYGGNTIAYSADGRSWKTATALPSSANWSLIAYGNGKFVAVAYNTSKAAYSADGINWTAATLPASGAWTGLAFGNGKFVLVASSGAKSAYSSDGVNWTAAELPASVKWRAAAYGNGKFVAVAYQTDQSAYSAG